MPEASRRWLVRSAVALFALALVYGLATRERSPLERDRAEARAETQRRLSAAAKDREPEANRMAAQVAARSPTEKALALGLPPCEDTALNRAIADAVTRFEDRDAFIHPYAWGQAQYNVRVNMLAWISTCRFDGKTVRVRHLMTGRELASWSAWAGYTASE